MTNKLFRKDIFCSAYSESGELIQFAIRIKNEPGAIAKVANLLFSRDVNILHGFHTAFPGHAEAVWGFFADLKDSTVNIESLVKEIKELDATIDVQLSRPIIKGFIVDELHFPIMVSNERSIVMKIGTIMESFKRLREKFGSGSGFILYEMGKAAGEGKAKSMCEEFDLDQYTVLRLIMAERAAKGWGVPKIEKYDYEKNEAVITVHELFECVPFRGENKEARSQFFRGYLAGVLGYLFNEPVSVTETECIGKGDENCKFVCKAHSEKPG
jgi:predicted hydrocarbon binding protein